jgi:hypothetical protein
MECARSFVLINGMHTVSSLHPDENQRSCEVVEDAHLEILDLTQQFKE